MLTKQTIEALIASEQYYRLPDTTVTICCLILKNGFAVIGKSATIDPDNFDEHAGRVIARGDAVDKIWELEGYRLKGQEVQS